MTDDALLLVRFLIVIGCGILTWGLIRILYISVRWIKTYIGTLIGNFSEENLIDADKKTIICEKNQFKTPHEINKTVSLDESEISLIKRQNIVIEEFKKLNMEGALRPDEAYDLITGKRSVSSLNKVQLKRALEARDIRYILHFTQESNIDSIIASGLFPRNLLHTLTSPAAYNDMLRLDLRETASSFSIGFPNYKLFWNFRQKNIDREWGIVAFSSVILLENECFFYSKNAASSDVYQLDRQMLTKFDAFKKLFENINGNPTREELNLLDSWPTNPQAEVMVEGIISPTYIQGVIFDKEHLTNNYKQKYPSLKVCTFPSFFKPRKDYLIWKGTNYGN